MVHGLIQRHGAFPDAGESRGAHARRHVLRVRDSSFYAIDECPSSLRNLRLGTIPRSSSRSGHDRGDAI